MLRKLSYEELNKLSRDGKITELLRGGFYNHASPTSYHQIICFNLVNKLSGYLSIRKTGVLFFAPLDVIFSDEDVVQPDLIYVSNKNRKIIKENGIKGIPDLVVEVVSDEGYDVKKKMAVYATYAVRNLWYIFPEEKLLKVYKLKEGHYELTKACDEKDTLTHSLFPGFKVKMRAVFARW